MKDSTLIKHSVIATKDLVYIMDSLDMAVIQVAKSMVLNPLLAMSLGFY